MCFLGSENLVLDGCVARADGRGWLYLALSETLDGPCCLLERRYRLLSTVEEDLGVGRKARNGAARDQNLDELLFERVSAFLLLRPLDSVDLALSGIRRALCSRRLFGCKVSLYLLNNTSFESSLSAIGTFLICDIMSLNE